MLFSKQGQGGVEWIIAFLGNPGPQYEGTRHNAGFMAGEAMARRLGVRIDGLRFRALTARAEIGGRGVLLMLPQTFMNLSGEAVGQAARFYKVPPERVYQGAHSRLPRFPTHPLRRLRRLRRRLTLSSTSLLLEA